MLKKVLLALAGISFALAMTACDDRSSDAPDHDKSPDKERHERRW
jgi:hypothetical protein